MRPQAPRVPVTDVTLGRRTVAARRQWMTALTPGCDPDMSTTGAPFGSVPARPRVLSGAVLLGFVALAVLLVGAGAPGALTVPVLVVAAPCTLALVAREIGRAHV